MKKILFVIATLNSGGAERSLINLLNELPEDRFKIDLLLLKKEGIFISQVPKNVTILEQTYALKKIYGKLFHSGKYFFVKLFGTMISKIFERETPAQRAFRWKYFYSRFIENLNNEYDVAIGYLGGETTDYIIDKVMAKKKVHWVHNDYEKLKMPKKYDLEVFKKVDYIVTISDECLKILKKIFPQYSNKFILLENITSAKIIYYKSKMFFPKEYNNVKNIILSIGRLEFQKGFDLAIDAAKIMKSKGFNFKWFIIGNGKLIKKLRKQIKFNSLSDTVYLLGLRENPYPYIRYCDIFAQTSRFEGKSVALDEAKILSKTILSTNYPTISDQIDESNSIFIVNIDAISIAHGLMSLVNNNIKCEKQINDIELNKIDDSNEINKYIKLFEL